MDENKKILDNSDENISSKSTLSEDVRNAEDGTAASNSYSENHEHHYSSSDHHHHSSSHHHNSSGHHHHSHHHSSYAPYNSSSHHSSSHHSSSRRSSSSGKTSANKSNKKYKSKSKIKLIIGAVISLLIILGIAGYTVYRAVIVPRMIEPTLEQVAEVMQDEKYTSAITKELRRLYEAGQVSGTDVEKYLEANDPSVSDYIPGAVYSGKTENSSAGTASKSNAASENNQTAASDKKSDSSKSESKSSGTSKSSMGVNSVKIIDENDNSTAAGSRYSDSAVNNYYLDTDSGSSDIQPEEKKKLTSEDLYAKAKKVMTPNDFSTASAIGSKLDVGKAKSLMNDNSALIAYIQSVLTPDEYSTALTIYSKYYNAIFED